jgi:hypothetical protein
LVYDWKKFVDGSVMSLSSKKNPTTKGNNKIIKIETNGAKTRNPSGRRMKPSRTSSIAGLFSGD